MNRTEIVKDIINKIQDKWGELTKNFYICYGLKDLAYKVANELLTEYNGNYENGTLYCKKYKDKFKIAMEFTENVYFIFDIWWATGVFGDFGLHCGNGKIYGKLPKNYKDIEEF